MVVAMALALASPADEGDSGKADWSHRAPIQIAAAAEQGFVEFALTPEVFDLAREDLADLRVVAGAGGDAPYVLSVASGKTGSAPLLVRLYNRTYVSGRQSSVTVDFGAKILKNRIGVDTAGLNFRRGVLVEASDDGQGWQKVREGAFLFRVAADAAGGSYDKRAVALPESNHRYLRVTVYNGPDDPEQVEIRYVTAWQVVRDPPETSPVPVAGVQVGQKDKEHATEIVLDLGYRKLPLDELLLEFADADFFRRVSVAGRNCKVRTIMTPVEDGPARHRTVEEPWARITGGAIYRYGSGGSVDESLGLSLRGARYRYLRVRIENADDPPLSFDGASVTRLIYYLAFPPEGAADHALYFGNPSARRPSYDLAHYVDRLREAGVTGSELGGAEPNPAYGPRERPVPWSEQHKWIIWIALLGALAALGFLVYRQIKTAPSEAQ